MKNNLINITDKKVREYLKSMYVDFKSSLIMNEEVKEFTGSLRKVVNNNKMNLLSGGLIYDYISNQLQNNLDYYIEMNLKVQPHLPVSENIQMVKDLYKEWEYLNKWFEEKFTINKSDNGLITVTMKKIVS